MVNVAYLNFPIIPVVIPLRNKGITPIRGYFLLLNHTLLLLLDGGDFETLGP